MKIITYGVDQVPRALAADDHDVVAATRGNVEDLLRDADMLLADWPELEADHVDILSAATEIGIPAAILFEEITPEILDEVILEWSCIDLPLDRRTLGNLDLGLLFDAPRAEPAPVETIAVGSVFPMPSDPEEYERRRGTSLVSPRMRHFLAGLRLALKQMARPQSGDPLAPPWDPTNSQLDAVDYQKSDPNVYRFVMKPGVTNPNLLDVLTCNRDPATRERLLRNLPPEHDAAADLGWKPLPPRLLILGESGTGKSLVADIVHRHLTHETAPLVAVNCAGLGVSNFDHEMFGAVPGAWTQIASFGGALTQAAYGTAFLDEIGDMPLETQSRTLAFLGDLMLRPTGSAPFFSFTQVVAATNRDLEHLVAVRRFRHDLLARFGIRVTLPALRERGQAELRLLIDFVAQDPSSNPTSFNGERAITHISADAMRLLLTHEYRDGNFRELEEIVSQGLRSATLDRSRTLLPHHLAMPTETHFRPDIEEYVVRVKEIDASGASHRVTVSSAAELRRVADIRRIPILADEDGNLAVLDGDLAYWYNESSEGTAPA